jgi:hypothetical protein
MALATIRTINAPVKHAPAPGRSMIVNDVARSRAHTDSPFVLDSPPGGGWMLSE